MKLGMINGWSEEGFAETKKYGLEAIEFCINGSVDSAEVLKNAEEIKALSEKYEVAVGAIGRWGMKRIDENGEIIPSALAHDKNLIDLCEITGCPVFNLGCNYIDAFSYEENCAFTVKYFSAVLDYARPKGIKAAVYNCDWDNFVYNPKAWEKVLGALPELGIKFDSSHTINRGEDYIATIRDWGKKFYHFHAKGLLRINGESYDDSPVGLDSIHWAEVMSLLYLSDYNAMVSIEPHSGRWQGAKRHWATQFSVNYLRPYIMPDNYGETDAGFMPPSGE